MQLKCSCPCKVNLLLHILGKRPDGFHELETIMHPVPVFDALSFDLEEELGIRLTCDPPILPCDRQNLVFRAAEAFLEKAPQTRGVRIHLEKRVPLGAGLGGGSSNAAHTLLALNRLFDSPVDSAELQRLAASIGSDVPFFLQSDPALATGRGEQVVPLGRLQALEHVWIFLVHPGFGVSTAWAYRAWAEHRTTSARSPGHAGKVIERLRHGSLAEAAKDLFNSLEAPVLRKYPLLELFLDFFREEGAVAALMSGSGSTTFALLETESQARNLEDRFRGRFGSRFWTAAVKLCE